MGIETLIALCRWGAWITAHPMAIVLPLAGLIRLVQALSGHLERRLQAFNESRRTRHVPRTRDNGTPDLRAHEEVKAHES